VDARRLRLVRLPGEIARPGRRAIARADEVIESRERPRRRSRAKTLLLTSDLLTLNCWPAFPPATNPGLKGPPRWWKAATPATDFCNPWGRWRSAVTYSTDRNTAFPRRQRRRTMTRCRREWLSAGRIAQHPRGRGQLGEPRTPRGSFISRRSALARPNPERTGKPRGHRELPSGDPSHRPWSLGGGDGSAATKSTKPPPLAFLPWNSLALSELRRCCQSQHRKLGLPMDNTTLLIIIVILLLLGGGWYGRGRWY